MTVLGSTPQGPASMTRSSLCSSRARISCASASEAASPGDGERRREHRLRRARRAARAPPGWPGMRTPIVFRLVTRRGTSRRAAQDEGVASRRHALQQAEARVVHDRVGRDLGEVAAHEREVVALVEAADAAQPLERRGGAEVAAERVARVGRIGDQPAAAARSRRRGASAASADASDGPRRTAPSGEELFDQPRHCLRLVVMQHVACLAHRHVCEVWKAAGALRAAPRSGPAASACRTRRRRPRAPARSPRASRRCTSSIR